VSHCLQCWRSWQSQCWPKLPGCLKHTPQSTPPSHPHLMTSHKAPPFLLRSPHPLAPLPHTLPCPKHTHLAPHPRHRCLQCWRSWQIQCWPKHPGCCSEGCSQTLHCPRHHQMWTGDLHGPRPDRSSGWGTWFALCGTGGGAAGAGLCVGGTRCLQA
jgi:hypothetical protein